MSEVENEKDYKFIKIISIAIIYSIIGLVALFTIGVSRVDASQIIRGFCGDSEVFNTNGNGYQTIPKQAQKCLTHVIYANTSYNIATAKDVELQFDLDYMTANAYTSSVNYTISGGYIDDSWYYGSSKSCTSTSAKSQTAVQVLIHQGYKRRVYGGVFCSNLQIGGTTKYPAMRIDFNTSPDTTQGHTFFNIEGYIQANSIVASPTANNQSNYNGPTSSQFQNWFNQQINNNNANTNTITNNNNENTEKITEKQEETNEKLDDLNDTLNDESIADLNNIQVQTIDDTPISDLLLLPINLANVIINAESGSCVDYTIGTLFNHTLKFKCINFQNLLGSNLYHTIDIFMAFFIIYEVAKMIITAFNDITSLRDGFDSLYSPKHADYKPKHGAGYERIGD